MFCNFTHNKLHLLWIQWSSKSVYALLQLAKFTLNIISEISLVPPLCLSNEIVLCSLTVETQYSKYHTLTREKAQPHQQAYQPCSLSELQIYVYFCRTNVLTFVRTLADRMLGGIISVIHYKVQWAFKWGKTHSGTTNSATVFKYNPDSSVKL